MGGGGPSPGVSGLGPEIYMVIGGIGGGADGGAGGGAGGGTTVSSLLKVDARGRSGEG
jgi:hypothetical protein